MMELLNRFAAFSLASGVLLTLLPEGTLHKTARMVVGLMILMLWAQGLHDLIRLPQESAAPSTILTTSSMSLEECVEEAAAQYSHTTEDTP